MKAITYLLLIPSLLVIGCTFTYRSQNRLSLKKVDATLYGSLGDGSIISDRNITIGLFR